MQFALFHSIRFVILEKATCPESGVNVLFYQIVSLVVAPLFVALVNTLVSHWLDEKDDN
ncbi:type I toxin-antitoxin system Fst family toxin [Candidatus Enterococcus mangumiae]|uniref:type I toxin-antitoxin system Fst family toxin n=1 Tax=Enterococcus TaxID=1350 RepID=UPI0030D069BB